MTNSPWLVALDIDGTILHEDGTLSDAVIDAVQGARNAGHEVTLATGRSVSMTLPILERLNIVPEYVVCSNGAITLKRDITAPSGYSRFHVEHFDPTPVLTRLKERLPQAHYAVEDEAGLYRYTDWFPEGALDALSEQVTFDELLTTVATRVVVIAPGHDIDDFLVVVEDMGLHHVSYAVGWTAWLDIAPEGVNKATALEMVRSHLQFDLDRVMAVGDGTNDIEMLQWAAKQGRAVAMGQAPEVVRIHSTEVTHGCMEDGVVTALAKLPGLIKT
jgi:Cof subfamily protein (haloacid dehalogenase superfamily)